MSERSVLAVTKINGIAACLRFFREDVKNTITIEFGHHDVTHDQVGLFTNGKFNAGLQLFLPPVSKGKKVI